MGLYNIFIILYPWSQIACWSHCFYGIIQHLHHFVSMVPNSMLVTLFLWVGLYNIFIIFIQHLHHVSMGLYILSQIACWSHCFYGIIQHLHHFVSMVPNSLLVTLFLWDYILYPYGHIVSMGLYNIFIILYPWSQIACWSHCFYGIIQHLHHFVSMVPNSMLVTLFLCDYTTSSSFCIHGPK